jgi:hypothetical protein
MKKNRFNKSVEEKQSELIKSIFSTIGVIILLAFINKATSPYHFWAKIPIMVMTGILFLKAFTLLGHKVANKVAPTSKRFEDNDEFELRDIEYNRPTNGKTWKDSDLV